MTFYTALFIFIWLIGWYCNGTQGTKFDLTALRDLFVFVLSKYGIDSWLNTQRGEKP